MLVVALSSLLLLPLLGSPILEPNFDLPLRELQLLRNLLLTRYSYVLVSSEFVLQLNPLCVIIDNSILVLGSCSIFGHFDQPILHTRTNAHTNRSSGCQMNDIVSDSLV